MRALWKIACKEDQFPGMWQRWYRNQCVAVGWAPGYGYKLDGLSEGGTGWSGARNAIKEMKSGDYVIVALKGNRVGRLGEITGKAIADFEWDPLVPINAETLPYGEVGRRIFVRWDLTVGPDNQDLVVQLPEGCRFSSGTLRRTITRLESASIDIIRQEMNNQTNWVGLLSNFKYEKALSDFIANYPNRLEDGLLPYPDSKIRELVFDDKTRLDVLLIDGKNIPLIVECKQHSPTIGDIDQLRRYMDKLKKLMKLNPRGMLVHGGAMKLAKNVIVHASRFPAVEIVCYSLDVHFRTSFSG